MSQTGPAEALTAGYWSVVSEEQRLGCGGAGAGVPLGDPGLEGGAQDGVQRDLAVAPALAVADHEVAFAAEVRTTRSPRQSTPPPARGRYEWRPLMSPTPTRSPR